MIIRIHCVSYLTKFRRIIVIFILICIFLVPVVRRYTLKADVPNYAPQPIDVVYTWVNGSDSRFLEDLNSHLGSVSEQSVGDASKQRFCDKYELKFSLRSLELYAPWVRHVYIVTNGQIPYWLDLDYERVSIITHEDIFPDLNDLPTFSSPAIEAHIHRIPGLSKRFIYFNDDIFLDAPIYLDDFVSDSRGFLVYLAWPVPMCNADCPWLYVHDGQCDYQCLNEKCQMDGGDCENNDLIPNLPIFNKTKDDLNESILQNVTVKYLYQTQNDTKISNRLNITKSTNDNLPEMVANLTRQLTDTTNLSEMVKLVNTKVILLNKLKRKKNRGGKQSSKSIRTNSSMINKLIDKPSTFDAFSESLQHCNRLFNAKYGFRTRYVAAHAPILIDIDIMNSLQSDFSEHFGRTSNNKLRTGTDIQFAFSYYNYLMIEKTKLDPGMVFDLFDTDKSGTWSDREIRTILTKLYELPLDYAVIDHFEMILTNCSVAHDFPDVSTPLYERYIDSTLPTISKEMIKNCPILTKPLLTSVGDQQKYPFTILKSADTDFVTFKMINSNITSVIGHLDTIRRKPTKFVCINDNLDPAREADNEIVVSILYDFYLSLFPNPSKFELSPDFRNRFLHMDELMSWRNRNFWIKCLTVCLILFLILMTLFGTLKKRLLYRILNKIL